MYNATIYVYLSFILTLTVEKVPSTIIRFTASYAWYFSMVHAHAINASCKCHSCRPSLEERISSPLLYHNHGH